MLSLATKDREWQATTNDDTPFVDVANKHANFSKLGRNYNVEYALSVIEAKHYPEILDCDEDLYIYVDLVRKLCVYWYYEKKAREQLNGFAWDKYVYHAEQKYPSLAYSGTYDKADEFAGKWWIEAFKHARNGGSKYELARQIITNPYLLFGNIYRHTIKQNIKAILMAETMFPDEMLVDKDAEYSYSKLLEVHRVVWSAWRNIKRTRKDASIVPKKRIIEIAERLRDDLQGDFDLVMPSIRVKKLMSETFGDEIDIQDDYGVLNKSTEYLNNRMKQSIMHDDDNGRVTNHEDVEVVFSGWGKMKIQKPPLKQSLPIKVIGRSRTFSDAGVNPRSMNRWATDKKIFTRRVKQRGGTVLIDVSGSMSLTNQDIEQLVRLLPASTIAMYSGTCSGYDWDTSRPEHPKHDGYYMLTPDNYSGELHILAEKGRWVGDIPVHAGENIVDVPAIDWLSKQAHPRILVSDLQVSGIDFYRYKDEEVYRVTSNFGAEFNVEALKKIKQGGIIPIMDINTAIEWVEKS
jgi:hypothetical protein